MQNRTSQQQQIELLERSWAADPRWQDIQRDYTAHDVVNLRGSVQIEYTLARVGANRLWEGLHTEDYVVALEAQTGNQAVQMVKAGLKALYLGSRPTTAEENLAGQIYSDQTPYSARSTPQLVKRISQTLRCTDQVCHAEGTDDIYWFAPIVAEAEPEGALDAFEITKALIEAGAAGIHFEDQLAPENNGEHQAEKVLMPTGQFIYTLKAARLAADVVGVPTLIIARTNAGRAGLIASDNDQRDRKFIFGERSPAGYYRVAGGLEAAIARGLAYAPYADLIWRNVSTPDLDEARQFAEAIHAKFPGKILAYNCSPSFDWGQQLDKITLARFQQELGTMGYKFQFIASAGLHDLDISMFELTSGYQDEGMTAKVELHEKELEFEAQGSTTLEPQLEAGNDYFDMIQSVISRHIASAIGVPESTPEAEVDESGEAVPELTV